MRSLATTVLLAGLAACHGPDPDARWLDEAREIAAPAVAGSRFPSLARGSDGTLVMSWIEPGAEGEYRLRYSTWAGSGWMDPQTVAAGRDWFINWADFPSVVPGDERVWAAHWLQQRPGSVYSYDVRLAMSSDAGHTWSAPMTPHHDGTATEHGFASLLPAGGSARVVWLDGRDTAGEHDHSGHGGGAMTLRSTVVTRLGQQTRAEEVLDPRVCDCCQTDVAMAREGAVVVYRDRSDGEIRNISVLRLTAGGWSNPVNVADDGWRIDACPVNGPAVDARGDTVAVAWFTAPDRPRVRLAFSLDGGRTFGPPVEVATGQTAGRVDVVLLPDGRAAVSWLADSPGGARLLVRAFSTEGPAGAATTIAASDVARSSGFPQMALAEGGLLFAWTQSGAEPRVRAAFARLR